MQTISWYCILAIWCTGTRTAQNVTNNQETLTVEDINVSVSISRKYTDGPHAAKVRIIRQTIITAVFLCLFHFQLRTYKPMPCSVSFSSGLHIATRTQLEGLH